MLFLENIRLAFSSLKANKMRSLLTMLGIIIGISAVIAIVTVGNSLTASLSDSMLSMGANNITLYMDLKEEEDETTEEGYVFLKNESNGSIMSEDFINDQMIKEFKEAFPDEVYAVSATQSVAEGVALNGKKSALVSITGVSAGYFVEKNTKVCAGRLFTADELLEGKQVALVSQKYAEKMYPSAEDAIGETIMIEGADRDYTFTIAGVYEKQDTTDMALVLMVGSSNTSTEVYIPLRTAQAITHNYNYMYISIVTKTGVDSDEFAKEVQSFFKSYYRTDRKLTVQAMSLASVTEELKSMMDKLTLGISVIAGIALLVGGIGVMNIMLVSITERTREIGTRKALGAPNSSIRTQFIVEAVVICLIGGLIGVLGGIGLGALIVHFMKGTATPSVSSIVISLIFSMGIGIFFGYYPANKAAQMDPIEALRYE